jgi:hypothetical protein
MSDRDIDRRRAAARSQSAAPRARRPANPVLALQRVIGNRAVREVLARSPTRSGTVTIAGVGEIKVKGGNLEEWAGKGAPDYVDVTSKKGKHSAKLEKLADARTRVDVTVMISPEDAAGQELNVGGGIQLEIKGARIKDYSVEDGNETWRIGDFTDVKRTRITHKIGSG